MKTTSIAASAARVGRAGGWGWLGLYSRPWRVLATALFASLLAHLLVASLAKTSTPAAATEPPLAVSITAMPPPPPPPVAAVKRVPPQPRPRALLASSVTSALAAVGELSRTDAAAELATPGPAVEIPLPPPPTEETLPPAAPDPASPQPLPPRIELVYRGFLGTRGFFIGDATYRLEHAANQYRITSIGEARGLAALFLRGQGRLTSTGTITSAGLQPNLYTAERSSDGHHEAATFDWETGVVLLNDNKTAGLELPTFDPLTVLWQFYFAPPEQDDAEFDVATTRRVYRSRFHRVGTETVKLSFADVEAQVWERSGGDGNLTARVWLAPSLHNVMVKMRLSNGRITGEALLDSIRVDETVARQ